MSALREITDAILPDSIEAQVYALFSAAGDHIRTFVQEQIATEKNAQLTRKLLLNILKEAYNTIPFIAPLRVLYSADDFAQFVMNHLDDFFPRLREQLVSE
jgi:hypothetical protein